MLGFGLGEMSDFLGFRVLFEYPVCGLFVWGFFLSCSEPFG